MHSDQAECHQEDDTKCKSLMLLPVVVLLRESAMVSFLRLSLQQDFKLTFILAYDAHNAAVLIWHFCKYAEN